VLTLCACLVVRTAAAQQKRTSPPASSAKAPAAAPTPPPAAANAVELASESPLFMQPDNGQVGTLSAGTRGRVIGQSGEWVRVQLEGWVRATDLKASTEGVLVGISAAEVRAEPDRFVGQTVDWRLQLVSVQIADELRPEMPAGQMYLLMRGPLPEPGFVYVMVSRAEADKMRALPPLSELRLRVTIRAAKTRYLPTPVVEMVSVLGT
jgi:hypothetical protein